MCDTLHSEPDTFQHRKAVYTVWQFCGLVLGAAALSSASSGF